MKTMSTIDSALNIVEAKLESMSDPRNGKDLVVTGIDQNDADYGNSYVYITTTSNDGLIFEVFHSASAKRSTLKVYSELFSGTYPDEES